VNEKRADGVERRSIGTLQGRDMTARSLTIIGLLGLALFAAAAGAREPWENRAPFGYEMMTRDEIDAYRSTLEAFETHDEKLAFWRAHVERMQQKAITWGVQLPDPPKYRVPGAQKPKPGKPPYFETIMTPEEVDAYYAMLSGLPDRADRHAFIASHILAMRKRGHERGVSVPGTFDWNYVFPDGELPPEATP